jgi:hypothetical protein
MRRIGSWRKLEEAIWDELKSLVAFSQLYVHRFYDSRSAGNTLPNQPSDFLAIHEGQSHFIEAKFSAVHRSLYSCFSNNVDDQQIASARMALRAGADYWVIFATGLESRIEVWPGKHLADSRVKHRRLDKNQAKVFPSLSEAIVYVLGIK